MAQYRLILTLREPLTLSAKPVVSNEIQTLQAIPATALRGALAAELSQLGRAAELDAWFGLAGPRWTPAIPYVNDTSLLVPMPLSFVTDKGDPPFQGRYAVFHTLAGTLPEGPDDYTTRTGLSLAASDQRRFQWTAIRNGWLQLDKDDKPVGVARQSLDASMHVGLHYARQANRDQALFSRREIPPQTRFLAWVDDPQNTIGGINSILLGKRRSAGNGAADIQWIPGDFPWSSHPVSPTDTHADLQLISDAIVLAPQGDFLRGLDQHFWNTHYGVDLDRAASASRVIPTWSGAWGTPREQVRAIAAGSVFRLRPKSNCGEVSNCGEKFADTLNGIAQEGIGLRRHEGYGWVSVNPSWLAKDFHPPVQPPSPSPAQIQEDPHIALQRDALASARSISPGKLNDPLASIGRLAAYADRATSKQQVLAYLHALATRPNDRGWKAVQDTIGEKLSKQPDLATQRFFLEALSVIWNPRAKEKR